MVGWREFGEASRAPGVSRPGPRKQGFRTHGRGGFRTCDLSRVKRALSH